MSRPAFRNTRLASVLMMALLAVTVLSGRADAAENRKNMLHVVTTFTVIKDIARNVAGDAAIVDSITRPGAEIHDYQPTPSDVLKAQKADLILWNGMNLERWFEKFFADVKGVPSVIVTEGITPMPINQGPYTGKPNPHAWMSPSNAVIYVENIRKALVEADPKNAATYNRNAADYTKQILAIIGPAQKAVQKIPLEQRWLVTSEGAFSYLARDLGLGEVYLWPINADQQGTPQQVRNVIDMVRLHKIPVVFSESTISDRPAKQVAKESGALYGGTLYVDSLTRHSGAVPTYLHLLDVTTSRIIKGFDEGIKKAALK